MYMAYVYILRNEAGRYYIGSTENLLQRLRHHRVGHTLTTKRLSATELALTQEYATLREARAVERRLKKLRRRDYIERIIRDGYIKLGG